MKIKYINFAVELYVNEVSQFFIDIRRVDKRITPHRCLHIDLDTSVATPTTTPTTTPTATPQPLPGVNDSHNTQVKQNCSKICII